MTRYARLLICAPLLLGLAASAPSFAVRKESHSETAAADVLGGTVVKVMPAATSGPFIHPGVLVNRAQLDEIKHRVAAGIEPQKAAFARLQADPLAALDYVPHPWATVECGSFSKPDFGCKNEQADSEAAYAQALLWYITGNKAYAENAVKIMNAWSGTLTGGHTNSNGPVQAAWTGEVWPRAAEIIRYSYPGWAAADIEKFRTLLKTQYAPTLLQGSGENGNKELAQSEGLINIGVFADDRALFNAGLDMWRGRAPATIYLTSDGPTPLQPPKWGPAIWGNKGNVPALVDGLEQETARDSGHAALALAAMVGAAETARQQGIDLYAEQGQRIVAALEFQAQFLPPNNAPPPERLAFATHPTWEIAYNHFHDRQGVGLPKMAAVLQIMRPTGVDHMMNWETLTHAGMGAIGLPPVVAGPAAPLTGQEAPRRPKITGISHIAFFVADLPKTLAFWHDFMGFEQYFELKKKDSKDVRIAFIKVNDHQHIELFNEPPPAPPNMLSHICFTTDNIEQMRVFLRSQGIPVAPSSGGKTKAGDYAFMIKDPDGMLVEFVQSLPDGVEAQNAGKFAPASRLSANIYHVGFLVGNSSKSMDFYGKMLGFQETWRGSSSSKELSWINLRVPDGVDYIELMLYRTPLTTEQYGTKNHVALEVADAQAAIATLEARPAFKNYPKPLAVQIGKNGKRQVNVFDPDGSRVELMEPRTIDGKAVPSSTAAPPPNVYN
jgi:catechol 2,3-dioxygenase-like lactoylglutathione lyase family enzyme